MLNENILNTERCGVVSYDHVFGLVACLFSFFKNMRTAAYVRKRVTTTSTYAIENNLTQRQLVVHNSKHVSIGWRRHDHGAALHSTMTTPMLVTRDTRLQKLTF